MATKPKSSSTRTRKATPAGRKTRSSTTRRSTAKSPAPEPVFETPTTQAGDAMTEEATTATDPETAKIEAFRRPDLIGAVAARTALKRSDAKALIELTLEEIGRALDAGEELVLPPLGKISVKKRKETGGGDMLTVKLKRSPASAEDAAEETPLAEPDGDS